MPIPEEQGPEQLVDIASWELDEEFAIFPVGSKPKRAVYCPSPAPHSFLIEGHRYLFKASKDWRIFQHWSEVIAHNLANRLKIKSAPCFVAVDSGANEVGVLVEFFYGYPGQTVVPRLITGADLLRRRVEDYEASPDQHHTVGNVLAICGMFAERDRFQFWGQLLAFDALIGNTDRHPENWGLLAQRNAEQKWRFDLAPSFDHGTSLAYQLRNEDISRESSPERLQTHLRRGRHHARWSAENAERGHFALCRLFRDGYPISSDAMFGTLDFQADEVKKTLDSCVRFDLAQGAMTHERAAYLLMLILARREELKAALGA